MKETLLQITQSILTSMGSDEVNSIHDTTEARDVASIIKDCYYEIISFSELPIHDTLFKFEASHDNTKPVLMRMPNDVKEITSVKYNNNTVNDPVYQKVYYLPFTEFFQRINSIDLTQTDTSSMSIDLNGSSFIFKFYTNKHPNYWTSPDDYNVIFDSFKSDVEDTVTENRILCEGSKLPTFQMKDSFIPELNPNQFQLLKNSAKSQCFIEIKQAQNPNAEKKERRHRILTEKNKYLTDLRTGIQKQKGFGRR